MSLYGAIRIGQLAFKFRKTIYNVLTAQDRYIGKAWQVGGYGRQTRYGVRTGAAAGTLTAPFISNFADDSPGNGIQTIQKKQPQTSKPYKTRNRFSVRNRSRYSRTSNTYQNRRCPSPRKY